MTQGHNEFSSSGTLAKPGWIGRVVRLLMGVICVYTSFEVYAHYPAYIYTIPDGTMLWFFSLLGFFLLPPVVSIGFGKELGHKPQVWYLILLFISIYYGYLVENTRWSVVAGHLLFALPFYVFGHLGISFLIAAAIGTPGCEMRSIPHLWSLLSGKRSKEHYCPGFIDGVDKWEAKISSK